MAFIRPPFIIILCLCCAALVRARAPEPEAVYQAAGRPAAAEKVYREDLETFASNGWSLYGLYQSLNAQGMTTAADRVKSRFDQAWKWADIELKASRI